MSSRRYGKLSEILSQNYLKMAEDVNSGGTLAWCKCVITSQSHSMESKDTENTLLCPVTLF